MSRLTIYITRSLTNYSISKPGTLSALTLLDPLTNPETSIVSWVIEDPVRPKKIKHLTAIPVGTYEAIWSRPATKDYAPDSTDKKAPLLLAVPGYSGIFIHGGQHSGFTSGCLALAQSVDLKTLRANGPLDPMLFPNTKGKQTRTAWSDKLLTSLFAKTEGEAFTVIIQNSDSLKILS